jgi:hypothetical protein
MQKVRKANEGSQKGQLQCFDPTKLKNPYILFFFDKTKYYTALYEKVNQ